MSGNIAVGLWLLLFGILGLVSTEIPKWIVPLCACAAGAVVLVGGGWWRRTP
jgi:hypothetical protein